MKLNFSIIFLSLFSLYGALFCSSAQNRAQEFDFSLVSIAPSGPRVPQSKEAFVRGKVSLPDNLSFNDLSECVYHGQVENVKKILAAGADVSRKCHGWGLPLHTACSRKKVNCQVIQLLLDVHADVNQVDKDGFTPLMCLAQNHQIEAIKKLIKVKADVNHINKQGNTAMDMAYKHGETEDVPLLLLGAGATLEHTDRYFGATVLIEASRWGHSRVVKELIRRKANVNHARHDGYTALLTAAMMPHPKIVTILLAAGADPNKSSESGRTALMRAAEGKNVAMVQELLQAGADWTKKHDSGEMAIDAGESEQVKKIIRDHGTLVDQRRKECLAKLELFPSVIEVIIAAYASGYAPPLVSKEE